VIPVAHLADYPILAQTERSGLQAVYRPRFLGHRIGAYAARAAGESCSSLTAAGGLNPCRSISHVAL
jgi:hypothetical protein